MKISKRELKFLLLLIPFFKPAGFSEIAIISRIYDVWFILAMLGIATNAISLRYSPSKVSVLNSVLQAYLFVNTCFHGGFSASLIRNTIGVAFVIIHVEMYLHKDERIVWKNLLRLFAVYSVLNALCGKSTFFQEYLFGPRTNVTTVSYPLMAIVAMMSYCGKIRIKNPVTLFLVLCTIVPNLLIMFRESVSTAIIGIMVSILMLFASKFAIVKSIKPYVMVIVLEVYNFIVVSLQSFDYMSSLFSLLGESMTMTGRLQIWSNAIMLFIQKPILGYGYRLQSVARGIYATNTTYVHNNFLQFCIDGGLIALLLFSAIMVMAVARIKSVNNRVSRISIAVLLGFEVAMISEVLTSYNYFYIFLVLVEYMSFTEEKQVGVKLGYTE